MAKAKSPKTGEIGEKAGANPAGRPKLQAAAASAAKPGDLVLVDCSLGGQKGILLPSANPEAIAIKLPSGYNIGINQASIRKIEVLETGKPPSSASHVRESPAPKKDFLSILGCGGTIASRIDYRTGAVDAATTPAELVAAFAHLSKRPLRAKSLFSISSEDTTHIHWQKIAQAAADEINGGAQGVVVTHGTDTLSYSSAALSFMLQNLPCPVIFTGSQRSSDRSSSDAALNMQASLLGADSDLSGVFICMHENLSDDSCLLHFGAKVRKMHTSRRDAFRSINCRPAARISPLQGRLEKISQLAQPRNPGKPSLDTRMNPNVALLYSYPGIRPELIASLSKYDGVVIAGTGLGHVPSNTSNDEDAMPVLKEVSALISSGIPVVIAPQTIYGRVNLSVYSSGRVLAKAGAIGHLCDFTPEAAYVKLMWVLGREKKMERVRGMMEKNIAGEISERSETVDFDF
ncbi:MAG: Glu-tRNA(Gln) amidotransferase subunit GatD [Candidatus Micrarchaeia archaeon]|jgi:glutamyl-tRNA(Gln) amidotransferase subunit D